MATRTNKMRLEISGDKECCDSLKKVNAELAEQKSVLKLLEEEYKENQNSQEALAKEKRKAAQTELERLNKRLGKDTEARVVLSQILLDRRCIEEL